jgi:hypothetical protein
MRKIFLVSVLIIFGTHAAWARDQHKVATKACVGVFTKLMKFREGSCNFGEFEVRLAPSCPCFTKDMLEENSLIFTFIAQPVTINCIDDDNVGNIITVVQANGVSQAFSQGINDPTSGRIFQRFCFFDPTLGNPDFAITHPISKEQQEACRNILIDYAENFLGVQCQNP